MSSLAEDCLAMAKRAKAASRLLTAATGQQKLDWLKRTQDALQANQARLVIANQQDLENAPNYGLSAAAIDRLRLTPERIEAICTALQEIALLPDPIGEVIDSNVRPNGLLVTRVRVPLGVVFFIFESRPNVTIDAAALCVKSGNAVILRGGKEALHSNLALHSILAETLKLSGLPTDAVQMVGTTDRAAVGEFLRMSEYIDVTIPRGGKSLIERVASEATMPVIKHFDGICHVYLDQYADPELAVSITVNSKTHRTGVCNAAECLLVDQRVAESLLPDVAGALLKKGVTLFGCDTSCQLVAEMQPATEENYRTEYLDLKMSVKVVDGVQGAIDHINEYGSGHTESIVTTHLPHAMQFTRDCDSAAVIVNASTRFNDGGEFGLGAEIGISTDKFHARGPCGLKELTSYKYIVHGSGQIR